MSTTTAVRPPAKVRAPRPTRVFGYLVAAGVQFVLLVLVNVAPGWEAVPFLTDEMTDVLPAVNASLVAVLVANVLWLLADPRWWRALGDATTACFSLVASLVMWRVFPFDVDSPWDSVLRWVVGLGVVGTAIAMVTGLVTCVLELRRTRR